ncbi:hypothetical protein K8I61_17595 [bacterium]|nr:hypothetical protein [bacterium]
MPDPVGMAPVALLAIWPGLVVLGIARRVSARALFAFAILSAIASGIVFRWLVAAFVAGDVSDKIAGLALIGFDVGWFALIAAIARDERFARQTRTAMMIGAFELALLGALVVFPRDYEHNLWLMDIANRVIDGAFGNAGGFARDALDAYGLVTLFVARHFVALAAFGVALIAAATHRLLAPLFNRDAAELADARFGRWTPIAAALVVFASIARRVLSDREFLGLDLAAPIVAGAYAAYGAALLARAWRNGRRAPALFAAIVALACARPIAVLALCGWLWNALGWTRADENASARPFATGARALVSLTRPRGLAVSFAVGFVFLISAGPATFEDENAPRVAASALHIDPHGVAMRRLATTEGAFAIDVAESAMARNAIEHACAERGARRCRMDEWEIACRGFAGKTYGTTDDPAAARRDLTARCNVRPLFDSPRGVRESAGDECVNDAGVADMHGNRWELVQSGGPFLRLAGGGVHYNDDQTMRCDFTMRLLPNQLAAIAATAPIGTRCCTDSAVHGEHREDTESAGK